MKILKNITGSDIAISDTGITIAAGVSYQIPAPDEGIWMDSVDVDAPIAAGDLVGSVGGSDLTPHMTNHMIHDSHIAESIHFDNHEGNGFASNNVQDAIEELKSSPLPDFVITDDSCLIFKEDGGFVLKG